MADVDVNIFSMTGDESSRGSIGGGVDMNALRGLNRLRCPPAVVITHDSDSFSPSSINPASGDNLSCSKGPLGSSTLSLADGRNGVCTVGGPSRAGSPRHSKVHPTDGNLPKSCSSVAVFSSDGQLPGGEGQGDHADRNSQRKPKRSCCSERAKRVTLGFFLIIIMCSIWVAITHMMKFAYFFHLKPFSPNATSPFTSEDPDTALIVTTTSETLQPEDEDDDREMDISPVYYAPFFTTWIFTACNCLLFPAYVFMRFCNIRKRTTAKKIFLDAIHRFQEKGLSALHFFTRSMFFCLLWVVANYMLIHSLSTLDATVVMGLQSSSASFVYLLSWVILHEQFVGIRIVAVIMCNTGIALLAYMDGVSKTSTLGGVVLASAAAAGIAVHKVLFRKLIGDVTVGQVSLFLTLVGLLNVLMLWPIGLTIYLVRAEVIVWTQLPYPQLAGVAGLFIVANILANFELIHSYHIFLKLGIISAVPVSAVLDVRWYHTVFKGMKLAGIILISIGYLLVLLPDNWPDYITRLLRWRWRRGKALHQPTKPPDPSQPRSRLRASSDI